jgi:hypothetical protein
LSGDRIDSEPTTAPGPATGPGRRVAARLWRGVRAVLITLALTLVVLIVLEGVSGAVLFVLDAYRADRQSAALRINRHDPELGWTLLPDLDVPALWGPGRGLRTNSQGFRDERDIPAQEPTGRVRLICSGDSFTFGEGVSGDDTWCRQLATIDPRFEPVNLGQGGYGVGQAFLWFMRSTEGLEHSVHVLAFVTVDFNRMHRSSFRLWEKPKLVVRDGQLLVANYPIGRNYEFVGWVERRRSLAKRFNLWRLVKRVEASLEADEPGSGDLAGGPDETASPELLPPLPDSASREVAAAIFASLAERNRAKGSTLVLVHLPGMADLEAGAGTPLYRSWDRFLDEEAARHGYLYVDLVPELALLSADEQWRLFITRDFEGYRGAGGHYSAYGNAVVARSLYDRLVEIPAIRKRLEAGSSPGEA